MAIRAELFVLPSPFVVRYTDEKGKESYEFFRTKVRAELDARQNTGAEPEVVVDLKEMFPKRAVKKPKK